MSRGGAAMAIIRSKRWSPSPTSPTNCPPCPPDATASLTGPFAPALSTSEGNLVLRRLLPSAPLAGRPADGLALTLEKNLPVAAGLGGGSMADAAAALRLFSNLATAPVAFADLQAVAENSRCRRADVPLFATSAGQRPRRGGAAAARFSRRCMVLVNPMVPVATADIFRRLEQRFNPGLPELGDPMTRPAQLALWLAARPATTFEPPARPMSRSSAS